MQTHNLIEDSFFKRKNLTLSHLDEMIEGEMIVENKFKSMLAALMLAIMPNIKADPSNLDVDSTFGERQRESDRIFSLINRSAEASKKILINKKPNQEQISSLKSKIDSDLEKIFHNSFYFKQSNVDISQYFPLIMSAYNLTDKDPEYIKIKLILGKLKQEFTKTDNNRSYEKNTSVNNGIKFIELVFFQKLLSDL